MTSNNEHIRTAKAALRPTYRKVGPWSDLPLQECPPTVEIVQLATAHAAMAQVEALAEVAVELRALREAVSRLGEQVATPLAMQATARRWFRRRPHTVERGDSA